MGFCGSTCVAEAGKGGQRLHTLVRALFLLRSGGSRRCEAAEARHSVKIIREEWGKLKHKMPFEIHLIQVDIISASAVIWAEWSIERGPGWGLNASPGTAEAMYNNSDCTSTISCNERAEVRFSDHKKTEGSRKQERKLLDGSLLSHRFNAFPSAANGEPRGREKSQRSSCPRFSAAAVTVMSGDLVSGRL